MTDAAKARRSFPLFRGLAIVGGILVLACARDSVLTAPTAASHPAKSNLDATDAEPPYVVISQVYGGGGNSGATLKNDFIEIHNGGDTAVSIEGWSVQYASSSGHSWNATILRGTLAAGSYYLVQEAAGTGGTQSLPTPDAVGTASMSATNGKVALVRNSRALTCGDPGVSCGGSDIVADLVGYGTAGNFEGAPAPGLSNTTADSRRLNECAETDNNGADFEENPPSPRNSASPAVICADRAPLVVKTEPAQGAELADPPVISVSFKEPVDLSGAWYRISCSATGSHSGQQTGGPMTFTLTDLGQFAPGESCNVTVFSEFVHDQDLNDPPDNMDSDFVWNFTVHGEPPPLPAIHFSEIHYDNGGDDVNEQIEIEGPAQTDLSDWSVVLYDGRVGTVYDSKALTGITIPATCGDRGVVVLPFDQIQNGSPDGFALIHGGEVIQFLSYEGSFTATDGPAAGFSSTDIGVAEASNSSDMSSLQLNATSGKWDNASRRTFGRCNASGPPPFDITFSGRQPLSDPALPVGFEDQLFATMVGVDGDTVSTTFTWVAETPDIASVDHNGVMHSIAPGRATFRATAANGTTATFTQPTTIATLGGTAEYVGNTAFGIPTDADPSDDFIINRDQYTISYSRTRNTPNWVSYEFDASHFAQNGATVDRCDCFTHDPALPSSFTHLTTADYTGAGAFAGYGIDRGHMARSFDFTSGTLDNARSYYLSNIIPQAAAVNQGPWKILEDTLGNLARFDDKEVYVIDGVAGSLGSVKGEGKITIPASEWKVAIVLPRDRSLADVHTWSDIEDVIAVIMPNDPSIGSDWKAYKTTVQAIQQASGYDLLSALPDNIERSVESNDFIAAKTLNGADELIASLASAANLDAGSASALQAKIDAAQQQLGNGNSTPAANQLRALSEQLKAMLLSGKATADQISALQTMVSDVIQLLTT